jgi:hypothetical protein
LENGNQEALRRWTEDGEEESLSREVRLNAPALYPGLAYHLHVPPWWHLSLLVSKACYSYCKVEERETEKAMAHVQHD